MPSDQEIINGIKQGDKHVFETLFKSLYSTLVRYAVRILRDFDQAEEVVQELFYSIWINRESLKVESSLKGYLFKSVHNSSLRYMSHKKVADKYASNFMSSSDNLNEPVMESIYFSELETAVERVLSRLPERSAKIFRMNRFEGKKYREIADELSISQKTVEADMGRALKEFRSTFGTK